jgi:hypothetical protein
MRAAAGGMPAYTTGRFAQFNAIDHHSFRRVGATRTVTRIGVRRARIWPSSRRPR